MVYHLVELSTNSIGEIGRPDYIFGAAVLLGRHFRPAVDTVFIVHQPQGVGAYQSALTVENQLGRPVVQSSFR